jgi:hypothetical protein
VSLTANPEPQAAVPFFPAESSVAKIAAMYLLPLQRWQLRETATWLVQEMLPNNAAAQAG